MARSSSTCLFYQKSTLHDGIPFELFTNEKVDLSRFIVFGTKCIVHALKIDRKEKWDIPTLEGYLVGYQDNGQQNIGSSIAIKLFIPPRRLLVRNLVKVKDGEFYKTNEKKVTDGFIPIQLAAEEFEVRNNVDLEYLLEDYVVNQKDQHRVTFNDQVEIIEPSEQVDEPSVEKVIPSTEENEELPTRPVRATHRPAGFYKEPDYEDFDYVG
jgi:hypothetical protein